MWRAAGDYVISRGVALQRCPSSNCSSHRFGRSSQTTAQDTPSLSRHLSRLWLKIHPDLFSQHPKEQAVNEQSFKSLQEALTAAESDSHDDGKAQRSFGPNSSPPTKLSFYFRGEDSSRKLAKTSVVLRHGEVATAIVQLFNSLSLEPPPRNVLPSSPTGLTGTGSGYGPRWASASVTLTSIVREARFAGMDSMQVQQDGGVAAARAAEWAQSDSNRLRLVLQRTRGVSIQLGSGLPRRGGRIIGMDRLAAALRRCPTANIAGLRVVIDGGFDTRLHSSRAELVLGVCATDSEWGAALGSGAVSAAAAERRALGASERDAAKALGVSYVLFRWGADDEDDDTAQRNYVAYRQFLAHALGQGGVKSALRRPVIDGVESLSLVLVGSVSEGISTASRTSNCVLESNVVEGVLYVDVHAPWQSIVATVSTRGSSIVAEHDTLRAKARAEDQFVWRVRRALRIDSLRRADDVSDSQWRHALNDLLADAGRIGGIMDRSKIVVGTKSCLTDSGEVQIAWNFRETLRLA
jgi:hypothetical protein